MVLVQSNSHTQPKWPQKDSTAEIPQLTRKKSASSVNAASPHLPCCEATSKYCPVYFQIRGSTALTSAMAHPEGLRAPWASSQHREGCWVWTVPQLHLSRSCITAGALRAAVLLLLWMLHIIFSLLWDNQGSAIDPPGTKWQLSHIMEIQDPSKTHKAAHMSPDPSPGQGQCQRWPQPCFATQKSSHLKAKTEHATMYQPPHTHFKKNILSFLQHPCFCALLQTTKEGWEKS